MSDEIDDFKLTKGSGDDVDEDEDDKLEDADELDGEEDTEEDPAEEGGFNANDFKKEDWE